MAAEANKVSNPLSLIAYFAGISESVTIAALPFLANSPQPVPDPLVWFASLFPVLIVILFFITLNYNHRVLYAPGDFEDQSHFLEVLGSTYSKPENASDLLSQFWKPDGKSANAQNARMLMDWMNKHELKVSISSFLYSQSPAYQKAREKAVKDLNLGD